MIVLFRLFYLMGPLLSLSVIFLPTGSVVAKWLWGFAAFMVAIHWYSYWSSTGENSQFVGFLWVSVWTPLLVTTLIAYNTRSSWMKWHTNPNTAKAIAVAVCAFPSLIAFFIFS